MGIKRYFQRKTTQFKLENCGIIVWIGYVPSHIYIIWLVQKYCQLPEKQRRHNSLSYRLALARVNYRVNSSKLKSSSTCQTWLMQQKYNGINIMAQQCIAERIDNKKTG